MITEIRYKNFKSLRDSTLPLGRFTLIVGANGTGKTTAMKALKIAKEPKKNIWENVISINLLEDEREEVILEIESFGKTVKIVWQADQHSGIGKFTHNVFGIGGFEEIEKAISEFKIFNFDTNQIAGGVGIRPKVELDESGRGLAGVLDQLRDSNPEIFEDLNRELNKWFCEYDRILFETPSDGVKSFLLRTTFGKNRIKAYDLSHGTLLALAYLTIAYLPNPPKIVAFEEPERGIHPRLLRNIQEAMDRLAYPENYGEKREPVQVIATTHSPYLLDLYKDRREEIVIADKDENGVHFERLTDLPNIEKILQEQDAPLGDVWISGVLGGVPTQI